MSYLAVQTIMRVGAEVLVRAVAKAANGSAGVKKPDYIALIGTVRHYKI